METATVLRIRNNSRKFLIADMAAIAMDINDVVDCDVIEEAKERLITLGLYESVSDGELASAALYLIDVVQYRVGETKKVRVMREKLSAMQLKISVEDLPF